MTDQMIPDQGRRLTGRLGTAGIVFMVIAAAAPLTVIGGNMPLAMGLGNGAGAPVGFLIAALVLLLFSIGFVTMTPHVPEAGAFFSYVTVGLGQRMGKGIAVVALIAYTAIQVGIYGYIGWAIADTVGFYRRTANPLARLLIRGTRDRCTTGLPPHRTERQGARRRAGPRDQHRRTARHRDRRQPGPSGLTLASFQPDVVHQRCAGHRRAVRPHRVHRVRGDRGVPRRSPRPRTHHPPSDVRSGSHHRRLLHRDLLGLRRRDRTRPGGRRRAAHPRR